MEGAIDDLDEEGAMEEVVVVLSDAEEGFKDAEDPGLILAEEGFRLLLVVVVAGLLTISTIPLTRSLIFTSNAALSTSL